MRPIGRQHHYWMHCALDEMDYYRPKMARMWMHRLILELFDDEVQSCALPKKARKAFLTRKIEGLEQGYQRSREYAEIPRTRTISYLSYEGDDHCGLC